MMSGFCEAGSSGGEEEHGRERRAQCQSLVPRQYHTSNLRSTESYHLLSCPVSEGRRADARPRPRQCSLGRCSETTRRHRMHVRLTPRLGYTAAIVLAIAALVGMLVAHAVVGTPKAHAAASSAPSNQPMCTQRPQLCTQVAE